MGLQTRAKQGDSKQPDAEQRMDSLLQACHALQARNRMLEHISRVSCGFGIELRHTQVTIVTLVVHTEI